MPTIIMTSRYISVSVMSPIDTEVILINNMRIGITSGKAKMAISGPPEFCDLAMDEMNVKIADMPTTPAIDAVKNSEKSSIGFPNKIINIKYKILPNMVINNVLYINLAINTSSAENSV